MTPNEITKYQKQSVKCPCCNEPFILKEGFNIKGDRVLIEIECIKEDE